MHAFRSHNCGELVEADVGQSVRLSGWVNRKRDHGQLVFVDLRDHYGLTQCVVDSSDPAFEAVEAGAETIRALSEVAAERLANTPTVARNAYIHPRVIALTETGLPEIDGAGLRGLTAAENRLLAFLGS